MTFCGQASTWAKVSFTLTILAFILQITGFGSTYWMARYTVRDKLNVGVGLWRMVNCSGYYRAPCYGYDFPSALKDTYVNVTRAMESITLILMFVATICLGFYVASPISRTRGMAIAMLVMTFVTAAFSLTGMIVWVVHLPEFYYPNWSFGLTVFAITLSITAGVLLIPDIREYDYKDLLKVGGEFSNVTVSNEGAQSPIPAPAPVPVNIPARELIPEVVPQNPMAAPTYSYLQYDKRRNMVGF